MSLFNSDKKTKTTKELKEKPSQGIVIWVVTETSTPSVPITFASTKEQAYLAIDQHIYIKHYKHFRAWCAQRDIPIDHANSWAEYTSLVLADELKDPSSSYTVIKVHYATSIIASLLRSTNNCTPLGCYYETEEELADYSAYLETRTSQAESGVSQLTPFEENLIALLDDTAEELAAADPSLPSDTSSYNGSAFFHVKKGGSFDA